MKISERYRKPLKIFLCVSLGFLLFSILSFIFHDLAFFAEPKLFLALNSIYILLAFIVGVYFGLKYEGFAAWSFFTAVIMCALIAFILLSNTELGWLKDGETRGLWFILLFLVLFSLALGFIASLLIRKLINWISSTKSKL